MTKTIKRVKHKNNKTFRKNIRTRYRKTKRVKKRENYNRKKIRNNSINNNQEGGAFLKKCIPSNSACDDETWASRSVVAYKIPSIEEFTPKKKKYLPINTTFINERIHSSRPRQNRSFLIGIKQSGKVEDTEYQFLKNDGTIQRLYHRELMEFKDNPDSGFIISFETYKKGGKMYNLFIITDELLDRVGENEEILNKLKILVEKGIAEFETPNNNIMLFGSEPEPELDETCGICSDPLYDKDLEIQKRRCGEFKKELWYKGWLKQWKSLNKKNEKNNSRKDCRRLDTSIEEQINSLMEEMVVTLPCNHRFHTCCLKQWNQSQTETSKSPTIPGRPITPAKDTTSTNPILQVLQCPLCRKEVPQIVYMTLKGDSTTDRKMKKPHPFADHPLLRAKFAPNLSNIEVFFGETPEEDIISELEKFNNNSIAHLIINTHGRRNALLQRNKTFLEKEGMTTSEDELLSNSLDNTEFVKLAETLNSKLKDRASVLLASCDSGKMDFSHSYFPEEPPIDPTVLSMRAKGIDLPSDRDQLRVARPHGIFYFLNHSIKEEHSDEASCFANLLAEHIPGHIVFSHPNLYYTAESEMHFRTLSPDSYEGTELGNDGDNGPGFIYYSKNQLVYAFLHDDSSDKKQLYIQIGEKPKELIKSKGWTHSDLSKVPILYSSA